MTPNIIDQWVSAGPQLRSVLRIVSAVIIMLAGSMKLFAFPEGIPPDGSTVELLSQMGIGGALEFFGGLLLLFGLFTRPTAFILSGEMAVAYFQFHAPIGVWPTMNSGIASMLYCFIWLYFSAAGPGPWSLDALLRKRRTGFGVT